MSDRLPRSTAEEANFDATAKRKGLIERLFPYDPEKRKTIKNTAVLATGTALGLAWANEEGRRAEIRDKAELEARSNELVAGKGREVKVNQGDTFQGFWAESGYKEVPDTSFDEWMEAVKKLNPDNDFNNYMIRENEVITIPVVEK